MSNKIIQSIHGNHGENILALRKLLEVRKTAPRGGKFPYIIYLYETKHEYKAADGYKYRGAGAVVGFYMCKQIIKTNAFGAALSKSNTPEEQLTEYADGKDIYLYVVSNPIRFPKPRPLSDFGLKRAPQSWQFIK